MIYYYIVRYSVIYVNKLHPILQCIFRDIGTPKMLAFGTLCVQRNQLQKFKNFKIEMFLLYNLLRRFRKLFTIFFFYIFFFIIYIFV